MEKKLLKEDIGESKEIGDDYNYGDKEIPIEEVITFLIDRKNEGATHAYFGGTCEWNTNNVEEIYISCIRIYLENSEQAKERIKLENKENKKRDDKIKESELQILEDLKNKYENK